MTKHECPACGSTELIVYEITAFELNTGDFYCHSVKSHDGNATVRCCDCEWVGLRGDFAYDTE